jgi:hypothetical protein
MAAPLMVKHRVTDYCDGTRARDARHINRESKGAFQDISIHPEVYAGWLNARS